VDASPSPATTSTTPATASAPEVPAALARYLEVIRDFNPQGGARIYPGSPFIIQHLLRDHDRLKLFELHPTDARTLDANIAQLEAGRQIAILLEDGFTSVVKFLPPPSRRALMLCDPSYEIKTDYARVLDLMAEALKRFATGTYAVWYPIIPRPESHDLPRRLKTMTVKAGRSWLQATLTVKSSKIVTDESGATHRPGLPASGMFVINPPFTLKAQLAAALPVMAKQLAQDRNATFSLDGPG
ncbi:MAG: 23S rRNA (adenine(2030)-N(6))-methyltransferase RlmJ, partial [Gammaproteobacteria bacterium]|nr:23S rRNA (adenine(2030)-N(6))-methyltransferase RlmJ [Gammaproteobacteria bacterium]